MKKDTQTPAKLAREKIADEAITLHIAGLSTREIAKRLGTSPATISRILTGKTKLPDTTVATYANTATQSRDVPPVRPHDTTTQNRDTFPFAHSATSDPQSIIDHAQSAVIDIIKRIQDVTYGEEDIAKLATAADKLTGVAERIANITRLANQQQAEQDSQSTANTFIRDFAARHKA